MKVIQLRRGRSRVHLRRRAIYGQKKWLALLSPRQRLRRALRVAKRRMRRDRQARKPRQLVPPSGL